MQIRKPGDVCLFIMVNIGLNIMQMNGSLKIDIFLFFSFYHELKVWMLNVLQVDLAGFVIWC